MIRCVGEAEGVGEGVSVTVQKGVGGKVTEGVTVGEGVKVEKGWVGVGGWVGREGVGE